MDRSSYLYGGERKGGVSPNAYAGVTYAPVAGGVNVFPYITMHFEMFADIPWVLLVPMFCIVVETLFLVCRKCDSYLQCR
jgi:hypothetical protein